MTYESDITQYSHGSSQFVGLIETPNKIVTCRTASALQAYSRSKSVTVCHLTKIPASVIFTEEIDFVFLFDLGQARESKLKFHLGIEDVKLFCDNIHIACQQRFFQFSIFHMIIKDSFQF